MSCGSVKINQNYIFPMTNSLLFQRPYLSIIRNHQKKKKPQFSKLSILTKSSIGSTKITSNQIKRNKKQRKNEKTVQKSSFHISIKDRSKTRSNEHQNRMSKTLKQMKIKKLGLSYEPQDFYRNSKQTPMSRTVCKRKQLCSISPMYSSMIFNSMDQNASPQQKDKKFKNLLDRTFLVLSQYKKECQQLQKQRDFYKKKYNKTSSKLKCLERTRNRSRF